MKWRWLGLAGVLALAAAFILLNRAQLPAAGDAARQANPSYLVAAAAVSVLYLINYGAMYRAAYQSVGLRLPLRQAIRLANSAHFLNVTVNSGGMAGLTVFLREAEGRGQGRGLVVSAYLLIALAGHLVFAVVLAFALAGAASDGQVGRIEVLAAGVFAIYTLFSLALVVAAARSRTAVRWLHDRPGAVKDQLLRRFGRKPPERPGSTEAADELYEALRLMIRRPRAIALPVFHAFLVEVAGVSALWFCLKAFGIDAGLEEPLVAYAMGVLFGIVGVLPAGIGFAEAGLGLALTSFGLSGVDVALTVVTYRLFEVWVPFAAGGLALQASFRRARAAEDQ